MANDDAQRVGMVIARVGAAVVLLGGAFLVLQPFIVALLWAAIVAYATWPIYRRLRTGTGLPRTSAVALTLVVFLAVGVPVAWFLVELVAEATHLVGETQSWLRAGAPPPEWLADSFVGPWVERVRTSLPAADEITTWLARFGGQVSERVVGVASGAATNVFSFFVTLLALYVFYTDGEALIVYARQLAEEVLPTGSGFVDHVGDLVRGVVFGLVGTAIIQGIVAAVGFAIFGVPSAVALGALTAVISFVPMGPPLVWGGAAVWLFSTDQFGAAIGMVIWGGALVSSIDNFLRPVLISRVGAADIPFLVILFGVLGGLAAFGLLGLFLGPVLLSVAFALVAQFPGAAETSRPA